MLYMSALLFSAVAALDYILKGLRRRREKENSSYNKFRDTIEQIRHRLRIIK